MQLRRAAPFLVGLSLSVIASPVLAEEPTESSDASGMAKAKSHFFQAKNYEEAGQFVAAAEEYLKAYELYQDPEFWYNAGLMHKMAGNNKLAVKYFRKYLTENPNGRVAEAAKATIEELKPKLDEDEPAEEQRAEAASAEGEGKESKAEPAPSEPADAEVATSNDTLKLAGIITGGAGILSLGVGVYFGLDASSSQSDLETLRDSGGTYDQGLVDSRDSSATMFYVFSGVGVAAIAAGGVLYFLGDSETESPEEGQVSISVAPSVTDTSAGIWCRGTF